MKKRWLINLELIDTPNRHELNLTDEQIGEVVTRLGCDLPAGVEIKVTDIREEIIRKRKRDKIDRFS